MTLRMDEGVRHVHGHHRTALPKRTSPPEAKTAVSVAYDLFSEIEKIVAINSCGLLFPLFYSRSKHVLYKYKIVQDTA